MKIQYLHYHSLGVRMWSAVCVFVLSWVLCFFTWLLNFMLPSISQYGQLISFGEIIAPTLGILFTALLCPRLRMLYFYSTKNEKRVNTAVLGIATLLYSFLMVSVVKVYTMVDPRVIPHLAQYCSADSCAPLYLEPNSIMSLATFSGFFITISLFLQLLLGRLRGSIASLAVYVCEIMLYAVEGMSRISIFSVTHGRSNLTFITCAVTMFWLITLVGWRYYTPEIWRFISNKTLNNIKKSK